MNTILHGGTCNIKLHNTFLMKRINLIFGETESILVDGV